MALSRQINSSAQWWDFMEQMSARAPQHHHHGARWGNILSMKGAHPSDRAQGVDGSMTRSIEAVLQVHGEPTVLVTRLFITTEDFIQFAAPAADFWPQIVTADGGWTPGYRQWLHATDGHQLVHRCPTPTRPCRWQFNSKTEQQQIPGCLRSFRVEQKCCTIWLHVRFFYSDDISALRGASASTVIFYSSLLPVISTSRQPLVFVTALLLFVKLSRV